LDFYEFIPEDRSGFFTSIIPVDYVSILYATIKEGKYIFHLKQRYYAG